MQNIADENSKRILCYNIINNKLCSYGNKCMYAHSLTDQKIDPIRYKVYSILKNNSRLSEINLISDNKLFRTMLELTRLCTLCMKHICPGGYNCRNGAININYKICYDDLMFGYCKRINCTSLHLTQRELVPYYKQKECLNFTNINKQPKKITRSKSMMNSISGILLTERFLMSNTDKESYDTDSETEEDISKTIEYLNNVSDSDESDDKSIFE